MREESGVGTRETIGVIGVGLVGLALAKHLLARGFGVVGFDVDAARLGCSTRRAARRRARRPTSRRGHGGSCLRCSIRTPRSARSKAPDGVMTPRFRADHLVDTSTGDPRRHRRARRTPRLTRHAPDRRTVRRVERTDRSARRGHDGRRCTRGSRGVRRPAGCLQRPRLPRRRAGRGHARQTGVERDHRAQSRRAGRRPRVRPRARVRSRCLPRARQSHTRVLGGDGRQGRTHAEATLRRRPNRGCASIARTSN